MFGLLKYPLTLMIYLGLLLTSMFLAKCAQKSDNNQKKISSFFFLISMIVLLSLICGFRGLSVGIDTIRYHYTFEREWVKSQREFVFYIVSFTVKSVFKSSRSVFIFWAFVTHGLIVLRIWDFKKEIDLSFAMFVYCGLIYLMSFSGIRQWAAVAIMFYATRFLYEKKKPLIFLLLIVISTFIHLSASISIVYLLFYLLGKDIKRWQKCIIILLVPTILIVISQAGWSFDIYDKYSEYIYKESHHVFSLGLQMPIMLLTLIMLHFNVKIKIWTSSSVQHYESHSLDQNNDVSKSVSKQYFNRLKWFELINLGLQSAGYFIRFTARSRWYFLVYSPVLYGYIFSKKNKGEYTATKILITAIVLYTFLSSSGSQLAPYYPYWVNP